MAQVIKVVVDKKGGTQVSVTGAGSSCHELTKRLESRLGEQITMQNTAEFYETEPALVQVGSSTGEE
jgi:hypothetical protein